jgi:hypothetical protein
MRDVRSPELSPALEAAKRLLEKQPREATGASSPATDRVLRAYVDCYRARGKTYHVEGAARFSRAQGEAIPSRAALGRRCSWPSSGACTKLVVASKGLRGRHLQFDAFSQWGWQIPREGVDIGDRELDRLPV